MALVSADPNERIGSRDLLEAGFGCFKWSSSEGFHSNALLAETFDGPFSGIAVSDQILIG